VEPRPKNESNAQPASVSADTSLDAIGVLKRREIEARILRPVLDALGREFGRERVLEIARHAIAEVARQHGEGLKSDIGGNSFADFVKLLPRWQQDGGIELNILAQSEDELSFDVVHCRFAEMYRALGVPELGALLSCNRDGSMMSGFNPEVEMTRTQTIMQGGTHCDFRFRRKKPHQ
jgi:predicted ArsR family transcriptional regulator